MLRTARSVMLAAVRWWRRRWLEGAVLQRNTGLVGGGGGRHPYCLKCPEIVVPFSGCDELAYHQQQFHALGLEGSR